MLSKIRPVAYCILIISATLYSEYTIPEIVIEAERLPEDWFTNPFSVSFMDTEELNFALPITLSEAMLMTPGIVLKQNGGPGAYTGALTRGGSSNGTAVYLDGLRLNAPQWGGVDLSTIPVSYIQEGEAVRGGVSSLWGEGPLYGLLNIRSSKNHQGGSVRLLGGSNELLLGNLNYQLDINSNLKIFTNMERTTYRGNYHYTIDDVNSVRTNTDFNQINGMTKFIWKELYIETEAFRRDLGVPGPTSYPLKDREKDTRYLLGLGSNTRNRTIALQFLSLGLDYKEDLTGSVSRHTNKILRGFFVTRRDLGRIKLTTGIDGELDYIESSEIGKRENKKILTFAKFALGNKSISPSLGASVEWSELYESFDINPHIGIVLKLSRYWVLRGSYTQSIKYPSFNDLYWPETVWSEGNPALRPERSRNIELGMRGITRLGIIFDIALFKINTDNLIQWIPDENDVYSPENIAETVSRGLESELRFDIFDKLRFSSSFTYLDARIAGSDSLVPDRPRYILYSSVIYTLRNLDFGLRIYRYGDRKTYYYNPQNYNREYITLPPASFVDIQMGFGASDHINMIFVIKNILDRNYEIVKDYPLPGRTFRTELSIEL